MAEVKKATENPISQSPAAPAENVLGDYVAELTRSKRLPAKPGTTGSPTESSKPIAADAPRQIAVAHTVNVDLDARLASEPALMRMWHGAEGSVVSKLDSLLNTKPGAEIKPATPSPLGEQVYPLAQAQWAYGVGSELAHGKPDSAISAGMFLGITMIPGLKFLKRLRGEEPVIEEPRVGGERPEGERGEEQGERERAGREPGQPTQARCATKERRALFEHWAVNDR